MSDNIKGTYTEGTRFFTVPSGEKVVIDENNRIETKIVVDLCDAVNHDLEGFLDMVSERATDTIALSDFNYNVTGLTPEGALILTVEGDISEILQDIEDEKEYQDGSA